MDDQSDKLGSHQRQAIERFFDDKASRSTRPPAPKAAKPRSRTRQTRWDDGDDADVDAFEKFDRRPTTFVGPPKTGELPLATVLQARGIDFLVDLDGETWIAKLAPRLVISGLPTPIVVGDFVRVATLTDALLRIEAADPRHSVLGRFVGQTDRFDPIAANIDLVLMVCTPQSPPFRAGFIDRYYTAAVLEGLPMAICLNKVDLGVDDDVEMMLGGYESLGIDVFRLSATTSAGLPELKEALHDKITLFTGHSGVGKSTLLNAIEPGLSLTTGAVTESAAGLGKGRHTTSSARLIPVALGNAFVVDSPGVREFGLGRIDAGDLIAGFPDVADAAQRCGVRHCAHHGETDCAVERELSAIPFGIRRLASYRSLAGDAL